VRTLGLLVAALLLTSCADGPEQPTTSPTPSPSGTPAPPPRPTLDDLPLGERPRIGYVDHQVYVARDGRRTPMPLHLGVSGIVPFDGGFLVSDTRYFEGTVGLHRLVGGREVDEHCSSGVPTSEDGWVTWLVASCPESADFVRAEAHRARPDGSGETVREVPPRSVGRFASSAEAVPVEGLPRRWYAEASAREDARHVLAVVIQGRWIAIVRIGPDGALELTTPAERFNPNMPAYALGPGR
jgi:hypothetical protein